MERYARHIQKAVQRRSKGLSERCRRDRSYLPGASVWRFRYAQALRQVFPSLDNFKYKDKWWVLDIGGNNLRLIAFIEFRDNRMYVQAHRNPCRVRQALQTLPEGG